MSDITPARTILVNVLNYLKVNDYRRASFERLVGSVPGVSNDTQLHDLVRNNPGIFLSVTIAGGRPGLRLRDSFNGVLPPEPVVVAAPVMTPETLSEPTPTAKVCNVSVLIQRAADARTSSEAEMFARAAMNASTALYWLKPTHSIEGVAVQAAG